MFVGVFNVPMGMFMTMNMGMLMGMEVFVFVFSFHGKSSFLRMLKNPSWVQ